ncbi:MAG: hypothetical protein KGL79_00885 [Acidobacteriota bacterium]|nr:hypothetical protein [Acidobacteriota bacterium]
MTTSYAPVDFSTESWSTIVVAGSEAESFLQGQLSQDVSDLATSTRWSLVLAPDSSVLSSVVVARDDEGFVLTLPSLLVDPVLARLRRFLLRTACTLDAGGVVAGPFASVEERLQARWPGYGELARQLSPHCYGRNFVDQTISFTKGCFTGQELVGRLDARGASVPWRVVTFDGPSVEAVDACLHSSGPAGPQGVTSIVATPAGVRGFGVAHRTLLTRDDLGPVSVVALS